MKKLWMVAVLITAPLFAAHAQAADTSTQVTFAKDSYCGSFARNIQNGKEFRLWLMP